MRTIRFVVSVEGGSIPPIPYPPDTLPPRCPTLIIYSQGCLDIISLTKNLWTLKNMNMRLNQDNIGRKDIRVPGTGVVDFLYYSDDSKS